MPRFTIPLVLNLKSPPVGVAGVREFRGVIETAIFNEMEDEIDLGDDGGIWAGLPIRGVQFDPRNPVIDEFHSSVAEEATRRAREIAP